MQVVDPQILHELLVPSNDPLIELVHESELAHTLTSRRVDFADLGRRGESHRDEEQEET